MSAGYDTAGCETGETPRSERSTCAAPSCWSDAVEVRVGEKVAVLCSDHRKTFLGVSS